MFVVLWVLEYFCYDDIHIAESDYTVATGLCGVCYRAASFMWKWCDNINLRDKEQRQHHTSCHLVTALTKNKQVASASDSAQQDTHFTQYGLSCAESSLKLSTHQLHSAIYCQYSKSICISYSDQTIILKITGASASVHSSNTACGSSRDHRLKTGAGCIHLTTPATIISLQLHHNHIHTEFLRKYSLNIVILFLGHITIPILNITIQGTKLFLCPKLLLSFIYTAGRRQAYWSIRWMGSWSRSSSLWLLNSGRVSCSFLKRLKALFFFSWI